MDFSVRVSHQKYYEKDDQGRKNYISRIKKAILISDTPLFQQMKIIADSTLKQYDSDFYIHDIEMILSNPKESFLWFVRESGTNLIHFNVVNIKDHFFAVTRCTKVKKIYFYNTKNNQLKKIKLEKAQQLIENILEKQQYSQNAI